MTARFILLSILFSCVVFSGSTVSAQSKVPEAEASAVVDIEARVFKSRKEVVKHLGQFIADGIPTTFNFKIHSLVWTGLPVNENAGVVIMTLPAETSNVSWSYSRTMRVEVQRSTTEVLVALRPDNPCMGGMRKRPEVVQSCVENLRVAADKDKELATFFATPRHKLKRVKVQHLPMSKRP